jgi:molecular chaperone GrpE
MSEDAADAAGTDGEAGEVDPADGDSTVDTGDDDAGTATEEVPPSENLADLADRVAEHDEALADEVGATAGRVAEVEETAAERAERIEELESRLKRQQADFENYKKRAERKQEEIRERATEAFVERIVGVRDNLVRALGQGEDADLRDGIESTLSAFDEALADENVEPIEPATGDELDPVRHEVLMRTESDRPAGTVVDCYRPGYEMAGRVIQTAQVTVSDGNGGTGAETEGAGAAAGDGPTDG